MISVAESMSRQSCRNSTGSRSLQTHREFYSDERDLRGHLEGRYQQAILGENSVQRRLYSTKYNVEIQNMERRNSEYALFESQRELESQRRLLEVSQWAEQAQRERIHMCGEESSSPGLLRKKLPEDNFFKKNKDWNIFHAA